MTLPLFHLAPGALGEAVPGTRLVLDGPEGRHAATVRRIAVGSLVTTRSLAERVRTATAAYLLHEVASAALATQPLPDHGEVLVIVGPEGGVSPDEVAELEAAGAVAVRLGPTVLRSSSAGPAALAVLSAAGRWR